MLGKTLILGGSGLLGQDLVSTLRQVYIPPLAPTREELDVLNFRALEAYVAKHKPSVIFNAAAYTQVDQAEDEEAGLLEHGVGNLEEREGGEHQADQGLASDEARGHQHA